MPYKEKHIHKVNWWIGDVALFMGVPTSTIRFYEDEFEWIKPRRNHAKNRRMYSQQLIWNLTMVQFLLKSGISIAMVKRFHQLDALDDLYIFMYEKLELWRFLKDTSRGSEHEL